MTRAPCAASKADTRLPGAALKATAAQDPGGMSGEGEGSRCEHLVGVGLNRRGVLAGHGGLTIWVGNCSACVYFIPPSLAADRCLALYETHYIVHYPGEAQ
jgi:hypothetical protein